MFMNPSRIKFETKDDVVDYITKGLPPTRKQMNELNETVLKDPDPTDTRDNGTSIPIFHPDNKDILNQVYQNRIDNLDKIGTIVVGAAIVIVTKSIKRNKKQKKTYLDRGYVYYKMKDKNEKVCDIIDVDDTEADYVC